MKQLERDAGFQFDPAMMGGDLEMKRRDGRGVRKRGDTNPDYATVCGSVALTRGVHYWETRIRRGRNLRLGVEPDRT